NDAAQPWVVQKTLLCGTSKHSTESERSSSWRRRSWDRHRLFGWLIAPKTLEPRRRQLCVAHGVLDRLVAQIALDRARIDALIGQLVAASMAQHVRVDFHIKARSRSHAFDNCLKPRVENGAPRSLTKPEGDPAACFLCIVV